MLYELYSKGLYLEETKIFDQKYFAVVNDGKLLIWTSSKQSALNVFQTYKEKISIKC